MTLADIQERLKQVDEISLLELLEITATEIVDRFTDKIEQKFDQLENDLDDTVSWDND
ncbi:MAG: hypothetical protein VW270_01725 [Candidatus Poseidoniales archaeon]